MPSDTSDRAVSLRPPRLVLLALFWATAVVVGVFALVPATVHLPTTGWDKSNHALAFASLAALGAMCWPQRRLQVLVALAAYGGAIEIAQLFTDTRSADWLDWFTDLVGLVMGSMAHALLARQR